MLEEGSASIVTALGTAAIAVFTLGTVLASVWVINQNRKALQEQRSPFLIAYVKLNEYEPQRMELIIENVGLGAAFDIHYKTKTGDYDKSAFWSGIELNMDRNFELLPPNQIIKHELGVTHRVLNKANDFFMNIEVTYKSQFGEEKAQEFSARPGQFLGLSAGQHPLEKIYRQLEKITRKLEQLPFDYNGLKTITETRTEMEARMDAWRRDTYDQESDKNTDIRDQLSQSNNDE